MIKRCSQDYNSDAMNYMYNSSISIPKLHRPLTLSGSTFHSETLGSFHLYAVSVDDRIIFHMHMLTYEISASSSPVFLIGML